MKIHFRTKRSALIKYAEMYEHVDWYAHFIDYDKTFDCAKRESIIEILEYTGIERDQEILKLSDNYTGTNQQ